VARDASADDRSADDHSAIVQLTIDYCWALDTGTWDDLRSVFTPDVIADLGAGGQHGIEEIIERVSSALGPLDDSQHMVTNHQVTIDASGDSPGDSATGRCYVQAQHIRNDAEGGSLYTVGGRYEDRFVRTDDGWRIAERQIVVMWTDGNRGVFAAT
jgi:hypothetical protein